MWEVMKETEMGEGNMREKRGKRRKRRRFLGKITIKNTIRQKMQLIV